MNKKLLVASAGAAVIAAAGFGSIALAQDDDSSAPVSENSTGLSGELDAAPEDVTAGEGQEVFPSDGGTVFAQCTDDGPELVWWAPAEGYVVEDVEAVPDEDDDDDRDDRDAEIEFESAAKEVDYDVTCVDGVPQADIEVDHDDDDRDDRDDRDDDDDDWDDDRDDNDDDGRDDD